MENIVFFSLGSNLGHRIEHLETAVSAIDSKIGKVVRRSSAMETEPFGFISENRFMNMAIEVKSGLSATEILQKTEQIERQMGRTSKSAKGIYGDRIIDIDILFFNELVLKTKKLEIPHPKMQEREFVLIPLSEIAPNWQHPTLHRSVKELLKSLQRTI